ncbi:MAG: hypothetical protein Q8Q36_00450 [bacterium]|nr:hypothetical protein [bacterium]
MDAFKRELFQSLKTLVIALILSIGVSYVYAWTGPTAAAPGGNTAPPINTGSTYQTKSGWLRVAGTGNGGDPAMRIGVYDTDNTGGISGWWFSQNNDGKFAIHQNGVGDRFTIDGNGTIGILGTTVALSGGSESTYGAATVKGSKNGWSGLNFKDAAGTNFGTLMMHPSYSGFYNAADNNWRWYVDDSGNSYQYGLQYDAQNTGYYLDPNGTSRMNYGVYDNLYSYGWLQSPIFYDANNNGYYVDPNGTSRVGYVDADNINVYGTVRGGSYGFGGMYAFGDSGCFRVNPFTGGCSCPGGFSTFEFVSINPGLYICYK